MELNIEPKDIDRAHRLGRHAVDKKRLVIVKFILSKQRTKFKTAANSKILNTALVKTFLPQFELLVGILSLSQGPSPVHLG